MAELTTVVREAQRPCMAVGARTKPALSTMVDALLVSTSRLRGIVEYEPTEYTFTARTGTPLAEVQAALQEHGQYLPFDPLLVAAGATLGGTLAAAANGPGRIRFGGVRDFLVGVQWIGGAGTVLRGGGKVVKNAAGFDFPKLFCGSMGRLGILTEVTCKVFPQALGQTTLELTCENLAQAVAMLTLAARQTWELDALEILPPNRLVMRVAGAPEALESRCAGIAKVMQGLCRLDAVAAAEYWESLREFSWVSSEATLVKVPLVAREIVSLHEALGDAPQRFSQAGNVAWIAWLGEPLRLHEILHSRGLTGLVWQGEPGYLGRVPDQTVERLVKTALDPRGQFPSFPNFLS